MIRDECEWDFRARKLAQSRKDIFIGKVKKAVAAEPQVGRWKVVSRDIENAELVTRGVESPAVSVYQRGNDIAANVLRVWRQFYHSHPFHIPARRIEQSSDAALGKQAFQLFAERFRVGEGGTRTATTPNLILIDFAELPLPRDH
jgi:hypothetical protein